MGSWECPLIPTYLPFATTQKTQAIDIIKYSQRPEIIHFARLNLLENEAKLLYFLCLSFRCDESFDLGLKITRALQVKNRIAIAFSQESGNLLGCSQIQAIKLSCTKFKSGIIDEDVAESLTDAAMVHINYMLRIRKLSNSLKRTFIEDNLINRGKPRLS